MSTILIGVDDSARSEDAVAFGRTLAGATSGRVIVACAFLVDVETRKSTGESEPVELVWAAPPRPHALKLLINGERYKTTPLVGGADEYVAVPAGKLRVEAKWATDARGTGYQVVIAVGDRVYATCSAGTMWSARP